MVLYAYVCVCAFLLRRESLDMILGDKPLIFQGGSITETQDLASSAYRTNPHATAELLDSFGPWSLWGTNLLRNCFKNGGHEARVSTHKDFHFGWSWTDSHPLYSQLGGEGDDDPLF
jgi:hypothetical protein